ncbi:MAG: hypothetical protein V4700_06270 [Pseudomonadota bacterium]
MAKTRPKTIAALDVQHETKNIMKDFHDKLNNIQAAKFGYEIDILDLVNKFFNDMNARGEEEFARCLKAQSTFELTTDADKLKITSYAFRYLTALIVANYSTSEILQYFIPALAEEEVNVKPEKSSDSWRITYWFQLLGYWFEVLFGKKKYKVDLSTDKYYRIDLENALKNVAKFMIETMAEKGNSYVSLVKNSIFFVTELDVLVEEVIKRKTLEVPVEEVIKGKTAAVQKHTKRKRHTDGFACKSGTDDIFGKERVSEAAEQSPVAPPPPPPPETKPESKKKPSDSEPVLRIISTPDKSTNPGTNNDNNTTEIITIAQIHSVNSGNFASRSRFGQPNVELIYSVNSETETSAEPKKVRTTEVRTGGDIDCSLITAAQPRATTSTSTPPPPPAPDVPNSANGKVPPKIPPRPDKKVSITSPPTLPLENSSRGSINTAEFDLLGTIRAGIKLRTIKKGTEASDKENTPIPEDDLASALFKVIEKRREAINGRNEDEVDSGNTIVIGTADSQEAIDKATEIIKKEKETLKGISDTELEKVLPQIVESAFKEAGISFKEKERNEDEVDSGNTIVIGTADSQEAIDKATEIIKKEKETLKGISDTELEKVLPQIVESAFKEAGISFKEKEKMYGSLVSGKVSIFSKTVDSQAKKHEKPIKTVGSNCNRP